MVVAVAVNRSRRRSSRYEKLTSTIQNPWSIDDIKSIVTSCSSVQLLLLLLLLRQVYQIIHELKILD